MPGYTYTRTGVMAVVDSDNSIDSFAANTPPINGYGYHAYGALTNLALNSQALDSASWLKTNASVSANAATAPDGTTTADLVTIGLSGTIASRQTITAGAVLTSSVFVRKPASGGATAIRATTNNSAAWNTGASVKLVLTSTWQRLTVSGALTDGAATSYDVNFGALDATGTNDPDCVGNVEMWQGDIYAGSSFSEGGPLLVTAGATASIGAPTLSVTCANGSYTATYTFDDDSTQDIPTTIAAGAFTMPTYPTLDRPRVKRVVVA
jgi:hypothetical protein